MRKIRTKYISTGAMYLLHHPLLFCDIYETEIETDTFTILQSGLAGWLPRLRNHFDFWSYITMNYITFLA